MGYPTLILICLGLIQAFEVIDYSKELYALISTEPGYYYETTEVLFHVLHVAALKRKYDKFEMHMFDKSGKEDPKLAILSETCKDYIEQLTIHRNKRSFNILGKIVKFITGIPDSDDFEMVERKVNELTRANNELASVNERVRANINQIAGTGETRHLETVFNWLIKELSDVIHTINLAKRGILNTSILNLKEINTIIKKENKTDVPLMEILEHATFKIAQVEMLFLVLIRYPKLEKKCGTYEVRPVEGQSGILQLERSVMFCDVRFMSVRKCKKYISANICKKYDHTCTDSLLNGIHTNCTLIREHMPTIDVISNGKILMHGNHTMDNTTRDGTYLILFNDTIKIDNVTYTNDEDLMMEYLRFNRPSQYDIFDVIESENEKLRIPTLNLIEQIPMVMAKHTILSTFTIIVGIIILTIIIHLIFKTCKIYNQYRTRISANRAGTYMQALFQKDTGTVSFHDGRS